MTLAAATKTRFHEIKTSIGTGDRTPANHDSARRFVLARDNNRLSTLRMGGYVRGNSMAVRIGDSRTDGQGATAVGLANGNDDTRYELLSTESASFAIRYEVTATAAGAKYYFNTVRKGSVASGESVVDVMTGQPLRFEVVSGEEAVKDPLMKGEDASVDYIKVHLARPVPVDGQARMLILKTYKDAKSYYREGDTIVFNRSLSIPRNSVVLPAGYELVAQCPGRFWRNRMGELPSLHERGRGGAADCEGQAGRAGGHFGATAGEFGKELGSAV
jgi:hypothetical protein